MNIERIEEFFQRCNLDELQILQKILVQYMRKLEASYSAVSDDVGSKWRKDERYPTKLLGTLKRITDVNPGERSKYSVVIQDISRAGMRIQVDENFTPSRVMEITFSTHGGRMKKVFMEVARMEKIKNEYGCMVEVGCRILDDDVVHRLCLQEEQISAMRGKIRNKQDVTIQVIGSDLGMVNALGEFIEEQKYHVNCVSSIQKALDYAQRVSTNVIILCQGIGLVNDRKALEGLSEFSPTVATLAIIGTDDCPVELFNIGIDEVIKKKNLNKYLFVSIERALIGHYFRQHETTRHMTGRTLVISENNAHISLITYHLKEKNYSFRMLKDGGGINEFSDKNFDLIVADFNPNNLNGFKAICDHFSKTATIAICDDYGDGKLAMSQGASNYLCMPIKKEDIEMILENLAPQMDLGGI
ncbi:MAG: PilZ domain-containing protein [Phycisphaerae bacterium]|nr:PilZ domain-containing protein [Phycisphaerae bacterium]